jgi:hypothetical protein
MTRPALRVFDPVATTDPIEDPRAEYNAAIRYAILICDEFGPTEAIHRLLVIPPYCFDPNATQR